MNRAVLVIKVYGYSLERLHFSLITHIYMYFYTSAYRYKGIERLFINRAAKYV